MDETIACYRCGASLEALSLPLSRRDLCPGCGGYLHVCRMCRHYDPGVPRQCREDDAEDVNDKELANFCDYFVVAAGAFDAARRQQSDRARDALDALFGDGREDEGPDGDPFAEAEKLFR